MQKHLGGGGESAYFDRKKQIFFRAEWPQDNTKVKVFSIKKKKSTNILHTLL